MMDISIVDTTSVLHLGVSFCIFSLGLSGSFIEPALYGMYCT